MAPPSPTVLKKLLTNFQDTTYPHQRQKIVACTQPRRVAEEMDGVSMIVFSLSCFYIVTVALGKEVGYTVRFYIPQVYDRWNAPSRREIFMCWFPTSVVYGRKRLSTTHFCNATRQSSSMKRMSELLPMDILMGLLKSITGP